MSGPVAQCSEAVEVPFFEDVPRVHYAPGARAGKAAPLVDAQALIAEECDAINAMLLAKNQAYGNSAMDPLRIFSQASPEEQILVRIDDKLSRLKRGASAGEDVVQDLIGYLVLLRIVRRGSK